MCSGDNWEETGLAPCSEYDVVIVAVFDNIKYSEEVDLDQVLTPPEAGANLDPEIKASQPSAVSTSIRYGMSDKYDW